MKRILMLSPYDISHPVHGGQRRVRAMYDFLSKKFTVDFVSVTAKAVAGSDGRFKNIVIGGLPLDLSVLEDYQIMKSGEGSSAAKELVALITGGRYDCIQIEHPWLFPLIEDVVEKDKVKLIYSSHNIEYKLKFDLLNHYDPTANLLEKYHSGVTEKPDAFQIQKISDEIALVERRLVHMSKLVLVVSEADEFGYREMGAKNILLVRNCSGVEPLAKALASSESYITYVGSGHAPNVTGFLRLLGPHLGFVGPKEKCYLLGQVADGIFMNSEFQRYALTNIERIVRFGQISDDELKQKVAGSRCQILPILEGGGTNLKTVEALRSGRPIVATKKAFRGLREFSNMPEIVLADTASEFKYAVSQYLRSSSVPYVKRPEDLLRTLTWDYQLSQVENYY